jgi:hypothetical protein
MKPIAERLILLAMAPFVFLAAIVAVLGYVVALVTTPRVAFNTALSLDQAANAAGHGDPDESISSRAGKAKKRGDRWGCVLCRLLDWIVPNHCDGAIEPDEGVRTNV